MAVFVADSAVDFTTLSLTPLTAGTLTFVDSGHVEYTDGTTTDTLLGSGFVDGDANAGTVTNWTRTGGTVQFSISGFSIPTSAFLTGAGNGTLLSVVLASDDTLTGSADADHLIGFEGNDTIDGKGGDDTLEGSDGDDTLDGGTGADTLIGGDDNDFYFVDSASDSVVEALGEGTDTIQSTATITALAANVENLILIGADIDGKGNSIANTITGTAGSNVLDGDAGNDSLIGNGDTDTLLGGAGNDTLDGGIDADSLDGGANDDDLIGDAGNDTLVGQAGLDLLAGGANNDVIDGGDGADTLDGGDGTDFARWRHRQR